MFHFNSIFMEEKVITVKLQGLPKAAEGIHKVEKVKIFRTELSCMNGDQRFGRECVDYAVVLLDNKVVIDLLPFDSPRLDCKSINHGGGNKTVFCARLFSTAAKLVIMSEGETFNFVSLSV